MGALEINMQLKIRRRKTFNHTLNLSNLLQHMAFDQKKFPKLNSLDNWEDFLRIMEMNFDVLTSIPVKWLRPSGHFVKMIFKGSCVGNSSGGGGLVRDPMGKYIMAFILPLEIGTSIQQK